MSVIYRKYRPITFAQVIGQAHIKQTLQNEVAGQKIAHAYLFSGPRAVGKTTIARIFARAINCAQLQPGQFEPCNQCASCLSILGNKTLDFIEIDAASHTGVDNVRENIIAAAKVANSMLRYKVFIIDEVHMLSTSAFNALLKLMEEPPANVVFILATTELHKVPATIISRCQSFDFKRIATSEMVDRLEMISSQEGRKVENEVLNEIARLSEGCQRDAESLLGQILQLDDKKITYSMASIVLPRSDKKIVLELLINIFEKDEKAGVTNLEQIAEQGLDLEQFSIDLVNNLRYILLIQTGLEDLVELDEEHIKTLKLLSEKMSQDKVIVVIENFLKAQADMKWLYIPKLAMEIAFLKSLKV